MNNNFIVNRRNKRITKHKSESTRSKRSFSVLGIGLLCSSTRNLFQIMISGINLEIINYFKIVIVEKLITINKINLHQQSSSYLA